MSPHDTPLLGGMSDREFAKVAPRGALGGLPTTSAPMVEAVTTGGDGRTATVTAIVSVDGTKEEAEGVSDSIGHIVSAGRKENGGLWAKVRVTCHLERDGGGWHASLFDDLALRHIRAKLIMDTFDSYESARKQCDYGALVSLFSPAYLRQQFGEQDYVVALRQTCQAQAADVGRPFFAMTGTWARVVRQGNTATLPCFFFFATGGDDKGAPQPTRHVMHFVYDDTAVRWLISGIVPAP